MLPAERIARVAGFGMSSGADAYVFRPTSVKEIEQGLDLARRTGRKVVLRGAGRSYGDAAEIAEGIVLDLTRFAQILDYDATTGRIEVESGVTLADIWQHSIEDGWWLPVVSGTMFPTVGGALAMNIHGKNQFRVGTFADHVTEIDFLPPNGTLQTLKPGDELFNAVIGSVGLLGIVTRAVIQLHRVHSGDLRVLAVSCRNWADQFRTFEELETEADYLVSWVDCFGNGSKSGRGLIHAAWYALESSANPSSLRLEHQNLPDTLMGFIPKSMMWRFLKPFNRRWGMRAINRAKYFAGKWREDGTSTYQSLAAFSFLLDYVPNWRNAYLPDGFIQWQCFVPKDAAPTVFPKLIEMQQAAGREPFLGVMKRHKPDGYLLTHSLDGYSLALDFKVRRSTWPALLYMIYKMNDLVLDSGGRFYFAKDSTLRPNDVRRYLGEEPLRRFQELKDRFDPERILSSELAIRVRLLDR